MPASVSSTLDRPRYEDPAVTAEGIILDQIKQLRNNFALAANEYAQHEDNLRRLEFEQKLAPAFCSKFVSTVKSICGHIDPNLTVGFKRELESWRWIFSINSPISLHTVEEELKSALEKIERGCLIVRIFVPIDTSIA